MKKNKKEEFEYTTRKLTKKELDKLKELQKYFGLELNRKELGELWLGMAVHYDISCFRPDGAWFGYENMWCLPTGEIEHI